MLAVCEAVDLELAIQRLFVGGSAVVWSSSLRFEVVVGGVTMPCRALTFSFFTSLPIMTIVGRVEEKETTG